MGIWDTITDLVEAAAPWGVAHAEAPVDTEQQEEPASLSKTEDTTAEKDDGEAPVEESKEEESEDKEVEEKGDEDEEDGDEDEMVDPKEKYEAECRESKQCRPAKHHYHECVERVTGAAEGAPKEDCVEEFFHLVHCATQCAAPKVWSALK